MSGRYSEPESATRPVKAGARTIRSAIALVVALGFVALAPAAAGYAYTQSQYANYVWTPWNQRISSPGGYLEGGKITGAGYAVTSNIASYNGGYLLWLTSGIGTVSGTHPSQYGVSKCWWTHSPAIEGTQALACYRYI
jgi:hypothetical protein